MQFGLDALGGAASANVFLDLDANAAVTLSASGSISNSAAGTYNGCVDVGGGLSVNAGASGNLFGLWSDSTQVALWNHDYKIYDVRVPLFVVVGEGADENRGFFFSLSEMLWIWCFSALVGRCETF